MDKPDITPLIDDSCHYCGYVAKGNWGVGDMVDQIRWQWNDEFEFSKYCSIETRYFRWIPEPSSSDQPYKQRLEPSEPGRGAFLATVIWLI